MRERETSGQSAWPGAKRALLLICLPLCSADVFLQSSDENQSAFAKLRSETVGRAEQGMREI